MINAVPAQGYTSRPIAEWGEAQIGAHVHIGHNAIVYVGCVIADDCLIGDGSNVYVGCRLGEGVRIGRLVTISYEVQIGTRTVIMDGAHITGRAVIGERCFIGPNVTMANDPEPREAFVEARLYPPVIGDDVLIGAGAIILPGVGIGNGATIGAGALVDQDVPAGATIAGVRGRRV